MAQFVYPPVSVDTTGLATEAKQDDIITALGLQATEAKQDDIITELQDQETLLTSLDDRVAASLVPEAHDHITISYVTSGNGIGEIETVVYRTGGAGGTIVATLTLAYDANDNLSSVTKS